MSSKNLCFEVVGQLEHFTEEIKKALIDWCNKNNYQYAYILHDKDIRHNDIDNKDEKTPEHIHFLINTHSSKWTFQMLLARFESVGLKNTMLQKVRKGWNNALSYLVHRTEGAVNDGKHLYDLKEVTSNFDYIKTIEIIEGQVEEKKGRIDEVIQEILSLNCRRYNITDFLSPAEYCNITNKRKLDLAFQYVETKLKQERKDRDMDIFWIYGESGIGKTTLAKTLCSNEKWSWAVSSSSNDPIQDYSGEDCLILDDFRSVGWSRSDILKMFDNNTFSSLKSRYQNKQTFYLRAIIITSVQSPEEFWKDRYLEGNSQEAFLQLERRIKWRVKMYRNYTEKDWGHVYYEVTSNINGVRSVETYDFTEQLELIREKAAKEKRDSPFSKMKCIESVSSESQVNISSVNIDMVKKLASEDDIPNF